MKTTLFSGFFWLAVLGGSCVGVAMGQAIYRAFTKELGEMWLPLVIIGMIGILLAALSFLGGSP